MNRKYKYLKYSDAGVCLLVGVESLENRALRLKLSSVYADIVSQHKSLFHVLLQCNHGNSALMLVARKYKAQAKFYERK